MVEINFDEIEGSADFHKAKLATAKPLIENFFQSATKRVYKKAEISSVFSEHKKDWRIPSEISLSKIIDFLSKESKLREVEIPSTYEFTEKRFIWESASAYELATSLRKNSYLSHGSAIFLHALNDQIPHIIYLNYEQSEKPESKGELTQTAIDRAFGNNQRKSNLSFFYETDYEITIINGKHTNRLEVIEIEHENVALPVTGIERTLIDITVRPAYAGGVFQVFEAFKTAKDRVSVNVLIATLKKMKYVYPYHQAIGFYMERAGYPEKLWARLLTIGTDFNFYLAHHLPKKKNFDEKWKLYYPDGF
jgi:predicted transcriptional regulator of viral defense system